MSERDYKLKIWLPCAVAAVASALLFDASHWWFLLGLLAVIVLFVTRHSIKPTEELEPPYRKVISRCENVDGEYVELECGHRIQVLRHERPAFPCEECQDERP